MIACPGCGFEAPDAFVFCPKCATALAPLRAAAEERKTVTTLFCDLVGFTAMGENADPEDVDTVLRAYHAAARRVIESHGGTVEKFIGDAVVGVFGVPTVHEDDPERAVRAGLRLLEALEGMLRPDGTPLEARVGINTGEALVRLDVDPLSGRGFLTGDAVNVAARLQAAAPPGGVAVGSLSHELTSRVIDYEELPPAAAKGKAEPVAAWLAKAPVSRTGVEVDRDKLTPFVGRELELSCLRALFEKAVSTSSPQFALIVGEPGIGKSRLVQELFAYVDSRPEMTAWRQGRCLSYGEGVTFSALAEIIKAQAGILETDDAKTLAAKLDAVVPEGADRAWLAKRLRALVGLEAPQASPEENFTAWLRIVESLAVAVPLVVVLEDLHWADEGLLAFVEHLAAHADATPLLMLGTARPELFEQHPAFTAGGTQVNRIFLRPLTSEDSERLVAGLLGDTETPSQRVADIVARTKGNPFFAEESARLLIDRASEVQVPASVQAVVAARLDALPGEQKAVLAAAAVVGEVFWDGAVAALAHGRRDAVDVMLRALVGRRLVRRVRGSSMADENEYAFAHALVRDVAYAQMPRKVRAHKHAAAALWIEQRAGARRNDFCEILAHHYATALDLARAASEVELADSLREPAIRSLAVAADRTLLVDLAAAERFSARGLELAGDGPERLPLLASWGGVLCQRGLYAESAVVLREAVEGLKAVGDRVGAGRAAMLLSNSLEVNSSEETVLEWSEEAVGLLDDGHPSVSLLQALSGLAWIRGTCGDQQGSIEAARQSIDRAREWGMPVWPGALGALGSARLSLGDLGGLTDYERALEAARHQGLTLIESALSNNLGFDLLATRGPAAALLLWAERLELDRQRGLDARVLGLQCSIMQATAHAGRWDEALALADELDARLESPGDLLDILEVGMAKALVRLLRGDPAAARRLVCWARKRTSDESSLGVLYCWLLVAAATEAVMGHAKGAVDLLTRLSAEPLPPTWPEVVLMHPHAIRAALRVGDPTLAGRLVAIVEAVRPLNDHVIATGRALLAESAGELERAAEQFADAAARWHDFGVPYEEAQALLGQGRCLVALDRGLGAVAPLAAAREIFVRLGAKPALAETDELIRQVSSA